MSLGLWMETVARDFVFACRRLGRDRAFTAVACLSLALGIGANTAAYTVLHAVMFRALPVRDPSALVLVSMKYTGTQYSMAYPAYRYLEDHATSLDGLIAFRDLPVNVATGTATERATAMLVSGNYFSVLGVDAAVGSLIRPEDDVTPGSGGARGPLAVVSHQFWTGRLAADPGIVGRPIRVNGVAFTVAGVAPAGFRGTRLGAAPDVFVPMMFAPDVIHIPNALTGARNNWLRIMGRLGPGVRLAQAQAEMTTVFRQFNEQIVLPETTTEPARRHALAGIILLEPGRTGLGEVRTTAGPALYTLMGLVGVVLLLACVNVASLLVARAERHHRDAAIHVALGASTARLWSQRLVESLVLGGAGAALGLILARWMRALLIQLVPGQQTLDLSMDREVLGISLLLGIGAAVFLAVMAGWQSSGGTAIRALKGDGAATRLWLRKALIVGQLALSVVVLVAAALFGRTLENLQQVDPGFERQRLLLASIDPSAYSKERQHVFYTRMLDEVRAVPGVVAAALANQQPLENRTGWSMRIKSGVAAAGPMPVDVAFVSRDYFRTMGIALIRGRELAPAGDGASGVIVNETLATRYLAGVDPIGARLSANGDTTFEIVGVVKDTAVDGLRKRPEPMMYLPLEQAAFSDRLVLHVRAAGPLAGLAATVTSIVHREDPDIPVFDVRTIDEQIDRAMGEERTFAQLATSFGVLALVLSAVGLYGIIAYAVSRRTKELGIRLALGAEPRRIVTLVLGEAALLVAIGIAIGLPLAYALARTIGSLLYGVEPGDWKSLAAAVAVLLAVAVLSAWLPARRAARVDPLVALRYE